MNLKTLEFIYDVVDYEIHNWRGLRLSDNYKQYTKARDELKGIIEDTKKRSIGLRNLAYKNKCRLPVRMPFNIEVDIL